MNTEKHTMPALTDQRSITAGEPVNITDDAVTPI